MATSSSEKVKFCKRVLPALPTESTRESVLKQKFEIPEFDVERLHKLPKSILSQINSVEKDNTIVQGKIENLKDTDLMKKDKMSHITLKSGKKLEISLVEGSFRRIAGMREQEDDSGAFIIRTVEIKREPGKSLGFYIRLGDGWMRNDGIFVSRVNLGSLVETNGLLHVGDEIVKVNSVDVTRLALDDVVVIMQYVKKMVLTVKVLTSVTLTRAFSTRLKKRTPKEVAKVRRTSSYAMKIAMRQHNDSLSENDEINFGNPYDEIKLSPQSDTHTPQIESDVETASKEPEKSKTLEVVTEFYSDEIKVGNPYDETEIEKTADTKLDSKDPDYEEIAIIGSADSPAMNTKHDIADLDATKQQGADSPLASSTPVHHKIVTSTPKILDATQPMEEEIEEAQEEEKVIVLEGPFAKVSVDAPPSFKPPPPPLDELEQDANESSHLNLTTVTSEPTSSLSLTGNLILSDSSDADSQPDSLPPPIPPPLLTSNGDTSMKDSDIDEPPDSEPPPLPSEPPPMSPSMDSLSALVQPSATSQPNANESLSQSNDSGDKLFSGMLAATIYGADEESNVTRGDTDLLCTIAVDSVVRVKHTVKFSTSILEQSLGEELDPFHIELIRNQEILIRLHNHKDDCILEKVIQLSEIFGEPTNSKDTSVHELKLSASPVGELTISLEYQPMALFIKRMNPESNHYSCATFKDFVDSSPNSEYPLVVERCVKIVEEYGLTEPGLYQRCVSESSKNEALQVSLSQTRKLRAQVKNAVSQLSVHAFTGVLKDFFRNLPEPLLTNDISLSVTETASMENAEKIGGEVMRGFMDCLPEEVLSTLKLLLQHFRCVCQQGQENGLSVEKISEIFGPLLLAPSLNMAVDMNTSTVEYAEDYESQAKAIAILMSLKKLEDSPLTVHKV